MPAADHRRYPGPRVRDWLLLGVSGAFVLASLLLARKDPAAALGTAAFFGVCGAVAAVTIVRKRRFARLAPISVEIVGGTPIRPSRAHLATLGGTVFGLGVVLLIVWHSGPVALVICLGVMVAVGAVLLLGLATGRLPIGFLQFDPAGLTIGLRGASFSIPWDAVVGVAPGEFHDNPVLYLWLHDFETVVVRPPHAHARVVAGLRSNLSWVGAHVMIMTAQYRIDLPFLVKAIERYVADPASRGGLAVPRLPPGGG